MCVSALQLLDAYSIRLDLCLSLADKIFLYFLFILVGLREMTHLHFCYFLSLTDFNNLPTLMINLLLYIFQFPSYVLLNFLFSILDAQTF